MRLYFAGRAAFQFITDRGKCGEQLFLPNPRSLIRLRSMLPVKCPQASPMSISREALPVCHRPQAATFLFAACLPCLIPLDRLLRYPQNLHDLLKWPFNVTEGHSPEESSGHGKVGKIAPIAGISDRGSYEAAGSHAHQPVEGSVWNIRTAQILRLSEHKGRDVWELTDRNAHPTQ